MEHIQLAVVGAGVAGTAAAIEAAKAGVKVVLIDENPLDMFMMGLDVPLFYGQRLMPTVQDKGAMMGRIVSANPELAEAEEAGVDIRLGTYVWGAFRNMDTSRVLDGPQLGLADENQSWTVKYDHLIVAAGSRDLGMGFAGWNFAGAMGANAAYSLMNRYQAFTGRKMVVLGSGNLGLQTAKLALERGVEVKAIVEVDGAVRGDAAVAAELQAAGVPIHTSHVIKEATGATDEVESVTIVAIDGDNNAVAGSEIEVEADTVCLAIGLVPTVELLNLLDCEVRFDHHRGGYAPVVDEWMRTSVENTYACGDAAGYHDGMTANPEIASEQGRLAGIAAAEALGAIDSATAHERRSQLTQAVQSSNGNEVDGVWKKWLAALMNVGGLDVYVCQCEEVTRAELLDVQPPRYLEWESDEMSARDLSTLTQDGPVNPDQVKRLTRAGMGHCQGRRCREQVAMLLADESDTPLTEVPIMSYRPPVRPLPLRIMWAHEESQQMRDDWVVWFKHSRDYMREMQEETAD